MTKTYQIPRRWEYNTWCNCHETIDNLDPVIDISIDTHYLLVLISNKDEDVFIRTKCYNWSIEDLKKDLEKQYPVQHDEIISQIQNIKYHLRDLNKITNDFNKRVKALEEIVGEQFVCKNNDGFSFIEQLSEIGYNVGED